MQQFVAFLEGHKKDIDTFREPTVKPVADVKCEVPDVAVESKVRKKRLADSKPIKIEYEECLAALPKVHSSTFSSGDVF